MPQNGLAVSHYGPRVAEDGGVFPGAGAATNEKGDTVSERHRTYEVVLVGPSGLLLEGLTHILKGTDFQVLASAPSVDQLPSMESKTVLLILDAGRDMETALGQVRAFASLHYAGRIAVIQGTLRWPDVISLFQAGAHASFTERVAPEAFLKSLELIMLGEKLIPSSLLSSMPSLGPHGPPEDNTEVRLSPQEEQILDGLIDGQPNKFIARKLGIADATVKVHVKSILRKVGLHNRTQAAIWAINRGSLKGSAHDGSALDSPEAVIETNDLSSQVAHRPMPRVERQEPSSAASSPLVDRGAKANAEQAKPDTVNVATDLSFTQRWRLLPSERRMLEEQEHRDGFVAKMRRLRELREARDAMKR
jgi:DNA-binding NarL/FixJ family response regulator